MYWHPIYGIYDQYYMLCGWLRLAGSLKLLVFFAEYRLFYRALLQKRPIITYSIMHYQYLWYVLSILHRMYWHPIYDMTHWYVTWLIHVWRDSFIWDLTRLYMTWLVHTWHASFICDMTHTRVSIRCMSSHPKTKTHIHIHKHSTITFCCVCWHAGAEKLAGMSAAEKALFLSAMSSMMQCIAVCCSMLQCVAVRCLVLQCYPAVCCSVLQCVAVCCSVLQCVAACCSVLQCVAVCCRVL